MKETKELHSAEKPVELSWEGWKQIGERVYHQLNADHASVVAAGVAFYLFLALFPTLVATLSIYGLVMDPAQIQQQVSQFAHILPAQSAEMITGVLEGVAGKSGASLGWSLVLSVLVSLWSAQKGTKAVFEGINIAYDETDDRDFLRYNGITLLFTLGAILLAIVCTALLFVFPVIVDSTNLPTFGLEGVVQWLRWPFVALVVMGGLAITYKVAPERRNAEFRWVSWGAVAATVLWLVGSLLFSLYISNFGSYDKMYGSLSAVVILMLWFFITAYSILIGAELNSEMEHQVRDDTTIGRDLPMGQRNAFHADHVAE